MIRVESFYFIEEFAAPGKSGFGLFCACQAKSPATTPSTASSRPSPPPRWPRHLPSDPKGYARVWTAGPALLRQLELAGCHPGALS